MERLSRIKGVHGVHLVAVTTARHPVGKTGASGRVQHDLTYTVAYRILELLDI